MAEPSYAPPYVPFGAGLVEPPRVAAVVAVTALGANALVLNVLALLATINLVRDGDALSADALSLATLLGFLPLIVAGVAVMVWLWGARTNADVINELPGSWARPWVVFGWILPIMNFFVPRAIVGGVWYASAPHGRSAWPVNVWWAAWLVYLLGSRIMSLDDHGGVQSVLFPVVCEVGAVAALFAMFIVWRITGFQEEQAARLDEAMAAPPA
ncbi:DUF4328 domain-containing protein [Actinomadura monticuli]|uniref:DUF4328 domain-containing protein n=1 Tax=Actinomadura monticuli TaxID=3097367 RepID=A0ABV4QMK5_9ACTN